MMMITTLSNVFTIMLCHVASSVFKVSSHPPHRCHFPALPVLLRAHPAYVFLWEGFWVWPLSSVVWKLFHLDFGYKMRFGFSVPGFSLVLP